MSNKKTARKTPNDNSKLVKDVERVSQEQALITDKAFVVVGNVDAGKSTLIGVLTSGILDDGRGSARKSVARHEHEIKAGKTSDVSTRILRFPNDKTATLIDLCGHEKYFTTTASGISGMWPDYAIVVVSPTRGILKMTKEHFRMLMSYNIPVIIVVTRVDMAQEESCKIVNKEIRNLCGKYKRTVEFMNGYDRYHLYKNGEKLASQHSIKKDVSGSDSCKISDEFIEEKKLSETDVKALIEYLESDVHQMSCISDIDQGLKLVGGKQTYIPVVYVSNVDGYYMEVVKYSMMNIEPRDLWCKDKNTNSIVQWFRKKLKIPKLGMADSHVGTTFYIDNSYNVKGVGLVISGITRGDPIKVDDVLYMGPVNKDFIKVKLKNFHNDDRTDIRVLDNHHRGCIAIKPLKDDFKKNQIKKGMVLISDHTMLKNVGYRFQAAVTIFGTHSATLRTGYSPVIHAGTIRQTAKLILEDDNLIEEEKNMLSSLTNRECNEKTQRKIKAGDVETVWFKFRMKPEYINPGTVFVFRSGDIHGVGCVIKVLELKDDEDAQPEPVKRKYRRIRPFDRSSLDAGKKVEKVVVGGKRD